MNQPFWSRRTCVILTGDSKGIGQSLAVEISKILVPESTVILIAGDTDGLDETYEMMHKENKQISVECFQVNLHNPSVSTFENILSTVDPAKYELFLLIHNAESIGNLDHLAADMNDIEEWNKYMTLNLYSVTCLTNVFLSKFNSDTADKCIVNMTSLLAVEPFKSVGYYSVGKASREMYFRVLAIENPTLNILSYSPGPVIADTVLSSNSKNELLREQLTTKQQNQYTRIIQITNICQKLLNALAMKSYTNGGRIDFHDE